FEADVDEIIDALHATPSASPERPVLVPGEPEQMARVERVRDGIPLPDDLVTQLRGIAQRAEVAFDLS
ncbi:MAG: Ldh family oxidoreductase, partial [Comamonadaceae bacterium]